MQRDQLVIAGGGLTAARAVEAYREAGASGRVVLVAEEPTLPYHRPPLSKRYLRGEVTDTPHVADEAFYVDHAIDVLRGTAVLAVDPELRTVALSDGSRYHYETLLIATGATPRRLAVPGVDLDGVFTLRTVADSRSIREAAAAAGRAVVVGGGFIGTEVAASLRTLGLSVTLIHRGRGLFDQLRSPALSRHLEQLYRARGVEVVLGEEVAALDGRRQLESVTTKSGRRTDANLAVVGVGVRPNTAFLAGSGVATENGVLVDERFRTNVPGVYAAGDVANFVDPVFGRRRRIEHWSNASYQGTEVGKVLAGRPGGYDTVSSFFSEVFGTTIKLFGDTTGFDGLRETGSLESGFLAAYSEGGGLVAAVTVGADEELEARVKELIRGRAPVSALGADALAAR